MDFKDYYKILGVEPTADDKAIKAAYRKLARKYHPDVSKEKDAEAKFKDASEAYEALKSADKRAEYDELRRYGQHGQPFQGPPGWQSRGGFGGGGGDTGDFSDFFSSIFGNRGPGFGGGEGRQQRSAGRRGQDVEMELPIFLEETLSNESKKVTFQVPQYNANGQHVSNTSKSLNVKIPAGVTDGERIRLKGQGAPGDRWRGQWRPVPDHSFCAAPEIRCRRRKPDHHLAAGTRGDHRVPLDRDAELDRSASAQRHAAAGLIGALVGRTPDDRHAVAHTIRRSSH